MSCYLRDPARRGYEGLVDVQHAGERASRRVISDADCVVRLCVYRVSIRPDGMDVASQLVITGDQKMGWLGKFSQSIQGSAILAILMVHTKIHIIHYAYS